MHNNLVASDKRSHLQIFNSSCWYLKMKWTFLSSSKFLCFKSSDVARSFHFFVPVKLVESGVLKRSTGCSNAWRVMSPSRMFFLSAVLCMVLFHLVLGQNCSEHCKACGGPEKDQCLQCHTGFILHDNQCVGKMINRVYSSFTSCSVSFWCSFTLTDIDECGTDLDRCPDNTFCLNTHGSYDCKGQWYLPSEVFYH